MFLKTTAIALTTLLLADPAPTPRAQAQPSATTQAAEQTEVDEALVFKAENAMQTLTTVRGRFSQTDWDGSRALGRFALQVPGKLRFDYAGDAMVVVADGVTLAVQDQELETTDSVPLAATPLGAILSGKRTFRDATEVVSTHTSSGYFYVTLQDKGDDWAGKLTLKFNQDNNRLAGWITLDETGAGTQVDLYEVDYVAKLNPRLFIIDG